MSNGNRKLTVWESACIITGYGIGGGVMAMPYLAEKNGAIVGFFVLMAAFGASYILHLMIADLAIKSGEGAQMVQVFSKYLFKGKWKNILSLAFFVTMTLVLFTNLAAYISGAAEILSALLPISLFWAKILFYIFAASVVVMGLKAVGLSEKVAVAAIFILVAILAVASIFNWTSSFSFNPGTLNEGLAFFGMSMFAFSAFFSIPQAVEGLDGNKRDIKKAIFLGLFNNFILILVISICAIGASKEVTSVAMIGWSAGVGKWAEGIGSGFTVLAMLTTYWSISLALSDIVKEQTKLNNKLCWVIATVPSLLITFVGAGGFMEFMRLAGGLIAIVIALLVVPAYRISLKEPGDSLLGNAGGTSMQIIIIIAYILMAVGNVVTI